MLIRRWLRQHQSDLEGKKKFFVIVCATPGTEKEKQKKIVQDNIPAGMADVKKAAMKHDLDGLDPTLLEPLIGSLRAAM